MSCWCKLKKMLLRVMYLRRLRFDFRFCEVDRWDVVGELKIGVMVLSVSVL